MEKVIKTLKFNTGSFPKETVQEAVANKEEITPLLLASLEGLLVNPSMALVDDDYMLHLYGVYLLAQFREKKAFPLIIGLVSLSPDIVEYLFDDVITESLPNILFSTYNGDQAALEELVENPEIYLWVRGAALDVLGKLYTLGEIAEDYFLTYLRQLIATQESEPATQKEFHMFIQSVVADQRIVAMLGDIKNLYDRDLIDETIFGDYVEFVRWMEEEWQERVKYIDDTISEMEWWACFQSNA